jgi:hypothetical protein
VDRFNLQIQIASSELKIQKLSDARDGLESQIGTELLNLAALRLQLGGRRTMSADTPYAAVPDTPGIPPDLAHVEMSKHLTGRGYAKQWTRHMDAPGGHHQLEYWTKGVTHGVMLMLTRGADAEPVSYRVFLDSFMCPGESLP